MKQIYPVTGMHCASCANIISRRLSKISGVTSARVNYATETVEINASPNVKPDSLELALAPLGYHLGNVINSTSSDELRSQVGVAIPLATISIVMMIWEAFFPYPEVVKTFFHHLLPILATYMLFVIGLPYLRALLRFARYRVANMDTLIGLGTLVAYLYSFTVSAFENVLVNIIPTDALYYDITIVVLAFVTLGKYLEHKSKQETGAALRKLMDLQVKNVNLLVNGVAISTPLTEVKLGDILLVKPGEKIPLDGIIATGITAIDESMMTGESLPVDKDQGDRVIGGTLNKQGTIEVKVTAIGDSTVLSQIIATVTSAQNSHAPIERLTDRISSIFVPAVLILSLVTLIIWAILGSPLTGLLGFIGILVIACPCALGLATPAAIVVGVGRAAKLGILVKNAESLEILRHVNYVLFDKTGTLTLGSPSVTHSEISMDNLAILASLESRSEHPLSSAIVTYAKSQKVTFSPVTKFAALPGMGVKGTIKKVEYFAGNAKLMQDLGISPDHSLLNKFASTGASPIMLATRKKILAYLGVSDTIKTESKEIIPKLHKLGIKVALVSGDHTLTAQAIGAELGIDKIYAEVMPTAKSDIVRSLQKEGNVVAMVGDGVNDAPALATADVGIAIGTGSDIAIESSRVTLLGGNLRRLPEIFALAHATFRIIKQNLFWAFVYNLVGVPVAALALLNPALAGAAMAFSSVSVVANSLRLRTIKL